MLNPKSLRLFIEAMILRVQVNNFSYILIQVIQGKKQGLEGVSEQSSESDDDEGSVPYDFQSKAQDTKIPAKKDGKGQAIKP